MRATHRSNSCEAHIASLFCAITKFIYVLVQSEPNRYAHDKAVRVYLINAFLYVVLWIQLQHCAVQDIDNRCSHKSMFDENSCYERNMQKSKP